MTYRVLARKWRPANFSELVGQTHVLRALQNALEQGRIHHAYLLTGTRGVGKTTIARILASCFNCEQGVSATPCGVCPSCVEIAEGRSLDLMEVDAASRTKVEDTRELLENSQFAPSHGRYKIYLIDEVHMLSNHSFNALLKTLEEPPEHVIFIFATTHPQKIPVTVLSRCLQFHLKNISNDMISQHLAYVLSEEKVNVEEQALSLIAHAAQGSMRDALSITEQAIAFGEGSISLNQVQDMLGVVDHQIALNLLQSVVAGDVENALNQLGEFAAQAADFSLLLDTMMQLLHRIGLEQLLKGAGTQGQLHADGIESIANQIDPSSVQIFYQALLNGKRDLSYAPNPLTGTEMILARMMAFRPMQEGLVSSSSTEAVNTQPATQVRGDVDLKKPEAPMLGAELEGHGAQREGGAELERQGAEVREPEQRSPSRNTSAPASEGVLEAIAVSEAISSGESDAHPELGTFSNDEWCERFSGLPLSGLVRAVAEHCSWLSSGNGLVELAIAKEQAALYSTEHDKRIAQGLSIYFGQPLKVNIQVRETADADSRPAGTPATVRHDKERERQAAAVTAIEDDPLVKKMIEQFDAGIDYGSIRPLN